MSYPMSGPYAAQPPPSRGAASLTTLTTALSVLLGLTAGAALLGAGAFFHRAGVIDDLLAGGIFEFVAKAHDADSAVTTTLVLFGLFGVATTIVWIVWQVRRARNRAFVDPARPTPATSRGLLTAWAITFGVSVVATIAGAGSHPSKDDLTGGGLALDPSKIRHYASADRITGVGLLGLAAAAIIFIVLARSFAARQRTPAPAAPYAAGYGAPVASRVQAPTNPSPVSEPGWRPDPYRQASLRWWDGQQWTGHVSGAPTS